METQSIADFLPPVYRGLLPGFFQREIPRETAATCSDCAMWGEPEEGSSFGVVFSRESKCCTHYPNLPNYLVGGLLGDTGPEWETGRSRVLDVIHRGVGVSPRGIRRPRKMDLLIRNSQGDFFGRSTSLICPFFEREKGICTVRPYWDAVCNTWFCKYVRGQEGLSFWLAVRRYLLWAEETLIRYTLRELGWRPEEIVPQGREKIPLRREELDESPPDEAARISLWGDWTGREEKFFEESFSLVSSLTRRRFESLAGITERILLDGVKERYTDLVRPRPPRVLRRSPGLRQEKTADGEYILAGYSLLDPFRVSERVYRLLDFFDGRRPNSEVCRLVREEMGVHPDDELLLDLYSFRILVSMDHGSRLGSWAPNSL